MVDLLLGSGPVQTANGDNSVSFNRQVGREWVAAAAVIDDATPQDGVVPWARFNAAVQAYGKADEKQ